MDEGTLLERPTAAPEEWTMPDGGSDIGAMRGFMLHRLCALSHRMRSIAVRDVLSEHQFDLRDWTVLATLDELGSGTQREIVAASNLDKVAVNRAASRLKERHLLVARPNVRDGRSHHLELSDLGRQKLIDCSVALADFEQKALARFGRAELDQVSLFIDRLMASID
ncbi:MAG: MarR family winged helix-turn-helix transcriptional regulator [Candidatus Andeanibacterium colombiense]|uniref:MarR family winged helix-turn-helix transcriptional regulator n=1 Tax=Candidatus Andeanibacterium colombiense TaxID=3121345 RepID=A0AAJ5X936_9SPHN|nr:MAG: MarR family winged helix-turn-helix transcriptional regulator [Sphingomonadaceae bacterium]